MTEILALEAEFAKLRTDYDRLLQDELTRYSYIIEGIRNAWASMPETKPRPVTVLAIFGRSYNENFISDYLAYVLDPARNGIGNAPLLRLLDLAGVDVEQLSIDNVTVVRERPLSNGGRIDILIELDDQFIIGIENKISAEERKGQTAGYAAALKSEFPDHESCYIYLTRGGKPPRSRSFKGISYQQLSESFSEIHYNWLADPKKSILWEDFIQHIDLYISVGEAMVELTGKSKLYIENHKMIRDLGRTYEHDVETLFNYIRSRIAEKLATDKWDLNFQSTRGWQQYYNRAWRRPGLNVHYEFYFSRDLLLKEVFHLIVHVEGAKGNINRFVELFKLSYPKHEPAFKERGISATQGPKKQPTSVAWKRYELDPNLDTIADQFLIAIDEFAFLEPIIDETFVEFDLKAQA